MSTKKKTNHKETYRLREMKRQAKLENEMIRYVVHEMPLPELMKWKGFDYEDKKKLIEARLRGLGENQSYKLTVMTSFPQGVLGRTKKTRRTAAKQENPILDKNDHRHTRMMLLQRLQRQVAENSD